MADAAIRRTLGSRERGIVLSIQFSFVFVAGVLLAHAWGATDATPFVTDLGAWMFALHCLWAFGSWRALTGRLFDGYSAFLLSAVLFSGGQLIAFCAGQLPAGILDGMFSPLTMQRTTALVTACVVSLHLGALLGVSLRLHPRRRERGFSYRRLRTVCYFFLAVSAIPMAIRTATMLHTVIAGGYFALYQQQAKIGFDNYLAVAADFFVPGTLLLYATSPRHSTGRRTAWVLAALHAVANSFAGARALALMTLLPMLLLHHHFAHRISMRKGAALGIAGLVILPIIADFRNLSLSERLSAQQTHVRTITEAVTAGVIEMGGSMETVAYVIDMVPSLREYDGGAGYMRALTTAVPNVFWDIHPAVKSGTYSQWLIKEVNPYIYEAGGGIGFSMIAESFVNFRWFGAPLAMGVFGAVLGALIRWSRSTGDCFRVSIEAVVLSAIIVVPRSETGAVARALIWTALLPYAWVAARRTVISTRSS